MKNMMNVSVIALLSLIAIGVFVAPDLNYRPLAARVKTMTESWETVAPRLERLEESLRIRQRQIDKAWAMLSRSSLSDAKTDATEAVPEVAVLPDETKSETDGPTPYIELSDRQERFANSFQRSLTNYSASKFVDKARELGLLPYGPLPDEVIEEIGRLFEKAALTERYIAADRSVKLRRWTDEARKANDFMEFPEDHPREEIMAALKGWKTPGATRSDRDKERGVIRFYRFPHEEHPELIEWETGTVNAIRGLILDVDAIVQDL